MCSIYNLKGKDGNVKVMRELAAHTGRKMTRNRNEMLLCDESCGAPCGISVVVQVTCPAVVSSATLRSSPAQATALGKNIV